MHVGNPDDYGDNIIQLTRYVRDYTMPAAPHYESVGLDYLMLMCSPISWVTLFIILAPLVFVNIHKHCLVLFWWRKQVNIC